MTKIYKCWLINYLNLDIDVIYLIKKEMIKVIQPPPYQELILGLKNNEYIKNGVVYKPYYNQVHDNFYKHEYDYVQTELFVHQNKILDIQFGYMLKNTLFDYDFIIDFKKSNINIDDIEIYWLENNLFYLDDDYNDHELIYNNKFPTTSSLYSIRGNVIFI